MARPMKQGLAYFPLDTDSMGDRKIQRLLLHFGCEGLSVFLSVLCDIYRLHGYYMPVTEEFYFDIGFTLHIHEKRVKEIIRYCVKIHLFDSKMLKNKRILTSTGIQKRYQEVCKRTKNEIIKPYSLEGTVEVVVKETAVSTTKTPQKKPFQSVSATDMQQKEKEKEIKKKEEKNKSKKKNDEINQPTETNYGNQSEKENTESARRAQLLQMAAEATANKRDA